jgi:hypothetical protein
MPCGNSLDIHHMRTGGLVGFEEVAWFNGGLFDDYQTLPMTKEDLEQALSAAKFDWAEIDPPS